MATVAFDRPLHQRVSWGALFAGFFFGFGAWLLLLALGAGIGLATFDPRQVGDWQALGVGFGIWGVIAGIIALFAAAFVAARLSRCEDQTEGMLHGVALWGFMLVAGLWIAASTIGSVAHGAASAAGTAAQAAGQAAGGAAQDPNARAQAQAELQQQGQQLQQQAQGALQQAQANSGQIAEKAASGGAKGAWAFFLYGLLTLVAAAFGGRAGVPRGPKVIREAPETAPDRPLSPQRA